MEEKKTKRIDLVVVMAILILIAFIGVMSFAMVQGIMQYTKKDAVAYADSDYTSMLCKNRLFFITPNAFSYGTIGTQTISANSIYQYGYNLSSTSFTGLYNWAYNSTSSNYSYSVGRIIASYTFIQVNNSLNANIYYGLGFPLTQHCDAGMYTFTSVMYNTSASSYVDYYNVYFYTLSDGNLVALDNNVYTLNVTTSAQNITFSTVLGFDNLYVRFAPYKNGVYQTSDSAYIPFSFLYFADSPTDVNNVISNQYIQGFNAGYYTGYAAASPSDDGGDQLDLVGNNLFEYQFNQPWDDTYAKLVRNSDTYKGWQIHSSGSAMYNYDEVNSYSIFKYYGSSVSYNYDFYYYLDDFDSGDYTFTFNYDYGDIDAHDFKLLALTFTIPETDPESEETLAYIQDDNADVTLTATYYQGRYLISISCMLSSSADLICRYAKLETGSNFTGFVPLDYYNYGYNQGYQNGQGDLLGSRNYILLDYLAFYGSTRNLTSDFVFNDTNYVYGDWTEDLNSVYNYNNPNFAIIDSLDGAPSGSQVGYKYENENLYGDILLMMPYCDDNLRVVFEVVDSGEVLITSPRDTVHWTLNSHLGNVNGQASWSCDLYTIHFYSPTQVNIYFLPYQPLDYGTEALYLPLNTKSWRVYSTQTNTALSSFDDGYLKGLDQGKEQQAEEDATLIARARGQGYEEGRRDALDDTSDYTFMGLIGSVIDAPITSFRGLLNFSILGVNMQSFVLAILTLCVIIVVIKIALGGK